MRIEMTGKMCRLYRGFSDHEVVIWKVNNVDILQCRSKT